MDDNSRYVCTKEQPYTPERAALFGGRGRHPDAKRTFSEDGYPGGDLDHFHCPHCGLHFVVEVAQ